MEPTTLDRLLAISSLFQQDMQRAFSGGPLTETRVHALWVLHHTGPTTQQALSESLGTTPRSVSALVGGLVAAGYVTRSPHPEDRRAVIVQLTDAAKQLMQRMAEDHARLSKLLIEAVAPTDRAAFDRGVNAVLARLQELMHTETVHYP